MTAARILLGALSTAALLPLSACGGAGATDAPPDPPSCEGLAPLCGPAGDEDCCESPRVEGGRFRPRYDGVSDGYTVDRGETRVTDLRLDRFEVTVGRWREFREAWVTGWRPTPGAGRHAHLRDGAGLVDSSRPGSSESGWEPAWDVEVDPSDENLRCGERYVTWSRAPGPGDARPVNCVSWFEAYAFCIWDGGFLPTSTEWNYAASGGSEQRVYPWSRPPGSTAIACDLANHAGEDGALCEEDGPVSVGSRSPDGDGRYGQADLAGNVWEWTLDFAPLAETPPLPCEADCAYLPDAVPNRDVRGGSFGVGAPGLVTSNRSEVTPGRRNAVVGLRCGRAP
ncbi:MAG: formylglycine-generating enzyme family protein [Deltaproteobacteria bacterium]|nr:formylglycine-generating enzyme family protein [Deltaproteobacteria bacterium]